MTATPLDTPATYRTLDPAGLGGRIAGLPEQIEHAWRAGAALELTATYRECTSVVVLGMGGSGIGGALMQALAVDLGARAPVTVVRGYRLPAHVGERSLVLASSNSGNTEETVTALRCAVEAGARCAVIATGGALLDVAAQHHLPALKFEWRGEPRSALGWSFASLLGIACTAGLLPDLGAELAPALDEMRALRNEVLPDVPESRNPAKQLARRLHGKLPVFVGAEALVPVAYRWRTQVNENAKSWAIADELPEMNHNAHAGYGLPAESVARLEAVLLKHAAVHPRVAPRFEATADVMRANGVSVEVLEITGSSVLAQVLRALQLGDYVSYYLAMLNGVDPAPTPELGALKDLLAKG